MNGRIWVTEAVNYRNFRNKELGLSKEAGDRIVVLQDTDTVMEGQILLIHLSGILISLLLSE